MPIVKALSETLYTDLQGLVAQLFEALPTDARAVFKGKFNTESLSSADTWLRNYFKDLIPPPEKLSERRRWLGVKRYNEWHNNRLDVYDKLAPIMPKWCTLMRKNGGAFRIDLLMLSQMKPAAIGTSSQQSA